MRGYETRWELGQNWERFWSEWNTNFGFRVYFSPSHYEAFVSTKDSTSGIFLPEIQKGLERLKEEYRISVKLLRAAEKVMWNKLETISISRYSDFSRGIIAWHLLRNISNPVVPLTKSEWRFLIIAKHCPGDNKPSLGITILKPCFLHRQW